MRRKKKPPDGGETRCGEVLTDLGQWTIEINQTIILDVSWTPPGIDKDAALAGGTSLTFDRAFLLRCNIITLPR